MPKSARRAAIGRASKPLSSTARCGTRCPPLGEEFKWYASNTDDFARACAVGAELAQEFALYLRDDDEAREGLTPFQDVMAAQAAAEANGANPGYRIGFWAELAKYLARLAEAPDFESFARASIKEEHRLAREVPL